MTKQAWGQKSCRKTLIRGYQLFQVVPTWACQSGENRRPFSVLWWRESLQWLLNQVLARRPHPLPHWAREPDYWVTNPAPDVEGELTIALLISVAVRRDKGSRLNVSCKTNQVMTPSKKEGCAHFDSFFDILGPFPFLQAIGTWRCTYFQCTHIFYDPFFRSY